MTTHPRVLIDVGPRMFATALARILTDRGCVVDVGSNPDGHDLALVAEAGAEGKLAATQIVLPSLEGGGVTVRISDPRGWRKAVVHNLDELLALIESALTAEQIEP